MGRLKQPTEGGSGGKRGHSNMEHWEYTEEIKDATRSRRRSEDDRLTQDGTDEYLDEGSDGEEADR